MTARAGGTSVVAYRRASSRRWRLHPEPLGLHPRILYDTLAALWKAGCRSLDGYLSAVKQELVLNHGSLPEAFDIHCRRVKRAAGRGPPQQASALPFLRFAELGDSVAPLVPTGPCHPRRILVISSWWITPRSDACPSSGATAHAGWLSSKMTVLTRAQPGPWGAHLPVRFSAQSTCSKRSTSGQQSSPGRVANHSPMHRYSLPHVEERPPKCKSAAQCLQAASLLSMSLDTLGTPSRPPEPRTSHPVQVAWPFGFPCCPEGRAALPCGPVPIAGSFTG